jgi:hypothetical protein
VRAIRAQSRRRTANPYADLKNIFPVGGQTQTGGCSQAVANPASKGMLITPERGMPARQIVLQESGSFPRKRTALTRKAKAKI